jgi:hypothetical protein
MSDSTTPQSNSKTLEELRAQAAKLIDQATAKEKLRRQMARDEIKDMRRRERKNLEAVRKQLVRDFEQLQTAVKTLIGTLVLEMLDEHGLENTCVTPADLKARSPEGYGKLIEYLQMAKATEAERKASKKKLAPKGGEDEGAERGIALPGSRNSSESGETH